MAKSRLAIAKSDIIKCFDEDGRRVFRHSDIARILSENRDFWRLAQSETTKSFIRFLTTRSKLERFEFAFPSRKEVRYTWGDVPLYELALSVRPRAYFSHYSALYLHELTEQVPKTIYINSEQSPKPVTRSGLAQERIDQAFRREQRATSVCAQFREYQICILAGKYTGQLGVVNLEHSQGSGLRVSNLERTLIDASVRPQYAGGVFEVLEAFRLAHGRVSVNRMAAFLKKIDYVYPYHQAIGFYLDRAGVYDEAQVELMRGFPMEFDFYLDYGMGQTRYDKKWRLFVPQGI